MLAGIKCQLGDAVTQKVPLTPKQMQNINDLLDMQNVKWVALRFSFRTLLRESNVVPDSLHSNNHVLTRADLK